jgi:hypothetical protein
MSAVTGRRVVLEYDPTTGAVRRLSGTFQTSGEIERARAQWMEIQKRMYGNESQNGSSRQTFFQLLAASAAGPTSVNEHLEHAQGEAIHADVKEYGWAGGYMHIPILGSGVGTLEVLHGSTATGKPLGFWGYTSRIFNSVGSAFVVRGAFAVESSYVIDGEVIRFDASKARLATAPSRSSGYGASPETLATVGEDGQVMVFEGKHRVNLTLEGMTFPESVPGQPGWLEYQFEAGLKTPPGVPAGTWAPPLNKTPPIVNPSNPFDGLEGY